jgi:hypothetical protein
MSVLTQTISFSRIVSWGASKLYKESVLRGFWGKKEELTVEELLKKDAALSRILWVVIRKEILPEKKVHQAALESALFFIGTLKKEGVYVDIRSEYALGVKQTWINGGISLGALKDAQRRAKAAQADAAELGDEKARLAAHIVVTAMHENMYQAFVNLHYATLGKLEEAGNGAFMKETLFQILSQGQTMEVKEKEGRK